MSYFSFSSFSTPTKGSGLNATSPTSPLPFCTSPTELHNTLKGSLESDKSAIGAKGGGTRSVKEFEDQLTTLKKENFNLKLRIYFLEEKLGVNFTLDEDNALKKNIELKVEIANLQKELQEKHDLLCQAVKAMELEDEDHKKNIQAKDEQLNMCQMEIEELRSQMHESRYDDGVSHRSDPTGLIFNRGFPLHDTDSNCNFRDFQEKCQSLEKELLYEKENSASLQILLDQTESVRQKLQAAEKECLEKSETISKLRSEVDCLNDKVKDLNESNEDLKRQLYQSNQDNQSLIKKMEEEHVVTEELISQISDLKRKHSSLKLDMEREHKKLERSKMMNEIRVAELEGENEKYRSKVRDLAGKLEVALNDSKKHHNLAVPSCQVQNTQTSNIDDGFSDTIAATNNRTPEKDALSVPLTYPYSSPAVEKFDVSQLEKLLLGNGESEAASEIISKVKLLKTEHSYQAQKLKKYKAEQIKACEIIKSMIDSRNKAAEKINVLRKRCEELEHQLGSASTSHSTSTRSSLDDFDNTIVATPNRRTEKSMEETQIEDLAEHYKALSDELEIKVQILKATIQAKDDHIQSLKAQLDEVLNKELNESNPELEYSTEKIDNETEKSVYLELAQKDKEIERLNAELKKCTCYLQEIVNKELWEKNREIEKMHARQGNNQEIKMLQKLVNEKDSQLKLLTEKISQLGLDVPVLGSGDCEFSVDIQAKPNELSQSLKVIQEENDALLDELNKYKQLYQETNEISSILSTRLEELAIFMDSLLKQKSVLGFLGVSKNRKLREIVDNTLELSKSFTMSMMINPEQSLMQLSNITSLLNGSILDELSFNINEESDINRVSLTYQSHLYNKNCLSTETDQDIIISALREQINNLQFELQLRDNELNKINNIEEISEETVPELSEKSSGKIQPQKLFRSPLKNINRTRNYNLYSENQSESEAWSEPDIRVSKQRIGLSDTMPILSGQKTDLPSTDDSLNDEVNSRKLSGKFEFQKEIDCLKEELEWKSKLLALAESKVDSRIEELESKVKIAENQCSEYEVQIKSLQNIIEELTSTKTDLENAMTEKDKEIQNNINKLEVEKGVLIKKVDLLEDESRTAKNELRVCEEKLRRVTDEWEKFKISLRKEYEEYAENAIKSVHKNFIQQLEETNKSFKTTISEKDDKLNFFKNELDKAIAELDGLKKEVETSDIKGREHEKTLQNLYNNIAVLQNQLEEKDRAYSEVLLEKAKLTKEKVQLETEFNALSAKESSMKLQLQDIQNELNNLTETFHQQSAALQSQNSKLELKLSELNSLNADLHNRLIRLQSCGVRSNHLTLPNSLPNRLSDPQHCEGQSLSSYDIDLRQFNISAPQMFGSSDLDRQEANSSPDLGIESDHGRFSSLETHTTVPRPVLQTIKLTESMNSLLSGENKDLDNFKCDNEQCCQRMMDYAKENSELKQKLSRLRRAFEEVAKQLALANQRKKQVEKTICKQIHKTSQVLRKAKANLDSGSESDVVKKEF